MTKYTSTKTVEAWRVLGSRFGDVREQPTPYILRLQDPVSGDERDETVEWGWADQHGAKDHDFTSGWFLRYTDGYTSWCPHDVFRRDYQRVFEIPDGMSRLTAVSGAEEQLLKFMDLIPREARDGRWWSIAKTDFERGFMALRRALFNPPKPEPAEAFVPLKDVMD